MGATMPSSRLLAGIALVVLALSLAAGASAATKPDLGRTLRAGGLVLVVRHAHTDQSKQDQDPIVLSKCSTQRNLSAQGRADARAIGRSVRRLNLRIGKVLSSAYCRTLETARLAFGRPTISPALLNTIASAHDARWRRQIQAACRLMGSKPAKGSLTVLVTHGILVTEATGQSLEEGEAMVLRPLGKSRFRVVGRVMPREWAALRVGPAARRPAVREYRVSAGSHPHDVAPAADGTVWYTAQSAGALGRLDPKTGKTTHVPLGDGSAPHGVIVGPDGAAWVTDGGINAIVRVDHETLDVKRFPLPASSGYANLNTATFDRSGVLWFTGQSGIYGRLDPKAGEVRVFQAPGGSGPYGIATTPQGDVWYASLAGSHIAQIDVDSGKATVVRPPTPGQGARRIWSDSRGRLWVSEWNAGKLGRYDPAKKRWREWRLPGAAQPYAVYVDDEDVVWLSDFGRSAIVRFTPKNGRFTRFPLRTSANVRQLLGRPGELWGAESGTDRLVVIRQDGSAGLRAHRPDRDDEPDEDDGGEHAARFHEPLVPLSHRKAGEDQGNDEPQRAEVADDVADPDPGRVVLGVAELLAVDPLGADPEHDVGRQPHDEQRAERHALQELGLRGARRGELGHRGDRDRAEEHRRPRDVQEQREVPAVGSDRGEHARHAPGFQIMSSRMRITSTHALTWSQNARVAPMLAASSGLRGEPDETSCAAVSAVAR
jgi:virginiamycin B lyase